MTGTPWAGRVRPGPGEPGHRVRDLAAGAAGRGADVRQLRRPVPVHPGPEGCPGRVADRGGDAGRGHGHLVRARHRARPGGQAVRQRPGPDHDLRGCLGGHEPRRRRPGQLAVRGRVCGGPGVPGGHHRPGDRRHPPARPPAGCRIGLGAAGPHRRGRAAPGGRRGLVPAADRARAVRHAAGPAPDGARRRPDPRDDRIRQVCGEPLPARP